jgi:homoserine dehydrogenase
MKQIKIGLLGMGNIGTGTYKALEMNRERITANTGVELVITKILEKDLARERDVTVFPEQFTQEPADILEAPDTDIVIELLGGIEPATSFMLTAMNNGKHVVTANKAAVAANYDKLMDAARANRVMFRFEASVGGGIPILNALTSALLANEYEEIRGILNGTTNYILTQMTECGLPYEQALRSAQAQGFAEADPTSDVEGYDVANKLSILISLAFGKRVPPGDIPTVGITGVTMRDIEKAAADGGKLKLIALARRKGDDIEYSVGPTFVPNEHPLAGVSNEFNAIFVRGNAVGELMFYGKGAGALPTASAVLGDVAEIARAVTR